jgi:hypothetical protein
MRRVVLLLSLVACAPSHVNFPPPATDLTPEQRVDEYNHLVGTKEHWISQNGNMVQHSIILQDGREVYYPEDLIPLVAPDSATATHARKAASARTSASRWSLVGSLAFLTGLIVTFKSFDSSPTGTRIGLGIALGGLIAWGGVGTYYKFKTTSQTHAAYEAFDDDLAARLNVCVAALQIVPCEVVPPPWKAPAAPAPKDKLPPGKIASLASSR